MQMHLTASALENRGFFNATQQLQRFLSIMKGNMNTDQSTTFSAPSAFFKTIAAPQIYFSSRPPVSLHTGSSLNACKTRRRKEKCTVFDLFLSLFVYLFNTRSGHCQPKNIEKIVKPEWKKCI